LKLDTANPTHSFKDRVVAVAAAKALELGRTTLACSSTGNLANAVAARAAAEGIEAAVLCPADLEPEKLIATAIYGARIFAVNGSYDDCSRLTVELSFELDWAFVNVQLRSYYAEGSKTLGFEIAEQLGWELPDAVIAPIASGSMFTKVHQAFAELLDLGLVEGTQPRLVGGQAEGCQPVARAFADDAKLKPVRPNTIARSLAIGSPADGELAVSTVAPCTRSRRTRSRTTSRSSPRRRASSERRRPASHSARCAKRFAAASSARAIAWCCSSRAMG
jgi:threonine synthase